MIKVFVTKAVILKGFENAPAIRFSENTENPAVQFRIGHKVYDKRAEKEHRFININVKAFGYLVERIRSMKLDAGSYVNIIGRYDEDSWTTQGGEKKSAPVIIADEIEYGDSNSANGNVTKTSDEKNNSPAASKPAPASSPPDQVSVNFTGYENFGGVNPFFPEEPF